MDGAGGAVGSGKRGRRGGTEPGPREDHDEGLGRGMQSKDRPKGGEKFKSLLCWFFF